MFLFQLWFDVESRYEATACCVSNFGNLLWFDVESRYEATILPKTAAIMELWFDVESRYEATAESERAKAESCGLM